MKAILFGVPHHCNLGDHAIAIAEKEIIKEQFPKYEYYEVAEENVLKCIDKIKEQIEKEDILFLHGGGNLGNQYPLSENGRRKVIQSFPNNKIILFPQTIFFQNNENGKKELEISKQIYNSHKKLYLMAREEVSYKTMKEEFSENTVFFTPDIVTILNASEIEELREGVLFIIRSDAESEIDNKFIKKVEKICKENFSKIEFTDTAKGGNIYQNKRKQKLYDMFKKYRKSELIITDRLHGMIFAAITGTPCIAIKSYNHKIVASLKWFEDLTYITNLTGKENEKEIIEMIETLKKCKNNKYNNKLSIEIFDKVFKEIREK